MKDIIIANNLCIAYNNGRTRKSVIEGLSFSIPSNSVFGIVGPSGIGKTSLLKALTCERSDTIIITGDLYFNGNKYFGSDVLNPTTLDFFYVPQLIAASISPLHHIGQVFTDLYRSRHVRAKSHSIQECYSQELTLLGLSPNVMACYPYELSGGMLQRALLAMSFAISPPIIFLDEPTSALDWESQELLIERIMRGKNEQELTIVIVSHDTVFLNKVCTDYFSL